MKKIIYGTIFFFVAMLIAGCASTNKDPYAAYKGMSDAQIFAVGEKALTKKDYNKAVKSFEALDALYPFGPYSQRAQYTIIYAYYMNDDLAMALAAAARYIRLYPQSDDVVYAYYMRGIVNMGRSTNWLQRRLGEDRTERDLTYVRQAFMDFAQVVQLFPHSQYAPDAQRRMLIIRNMLAQSELNVAKFYMDRKVYIGAANRASYLVEHYQGAPQVIPALAILVKAYRAMGEPELAQKAAQILRLNYPNAAQTRALTH